MQTNLERYKADLKRLIHQGKLLLVVLQYENKAEEMKAVYEKGGAAKVLEDIVKLGPGFKEGYQPWYSEALVIIKQLLPDRLADFVRNFEKPKATRKAITYENYVIEDCLQGLRVTRGSFDVVVDSSAAIPRMEQQLRILEAVERRFESSLFDIKQLVQADLFDSELDAAQQLLKNGFTRAAGAMAGVVLEKHLHQVCDNHNIKITKKDAGISHLNDQLKNASIVDTPQWRKIQHLGDIRNKCDHGKGAEPTKEEGADLIDGVSKIIKTLF